MTPPAQSFRLVSASIITAALLAAACKTPVEYYCDQDTPCADRYPDRPYCDLLGAYPDSEGRGHTCIPDPFEVDGGVTADGGVDAGAGVDASPLPGTPRLRAPRSGAYTGTYRVSANRQPTFTWIAGPGAIADHYEIAIDDSCDPTDFSNCAFPSPEVSDTTTEPWFTPTSALPVATVAPVGRRYYWSVRACTPSDCSPWAPVHYVEVGRLRSDLDGDGYGDLTIGTLLQDVARTDDGAAYLYFGGSRPALPTTIDAADVTLKHPEGGQDNVRFGAYLGTVGDVNGDGFSDLYVSGYYYDGVADDEGRVYLYYGRARGDWAAIVTTPSVTLPSPVAQINAVFSTNSRGGADINGDGYADLVLPVIRFDGSQMDEGKLLIYFGGASLPATWSSPDVSVPNPFGQADALFGRVALGDVNGDGLADIIATSDAVANPEASEGSAFIYFGRSNWPAAPQPDVIIDNPADTDSRFGFAVAACDLDGDGLEETIITDIEAQAGAQPGRVYIFRGRSDWPAAPASQVQSNDYVIDNPVDDSIQYGAFLDCEGSVDSDDLSDLVVGADFYDSPSVNNAGAAFLYLGRSSLATLTTHNASFDNPVAVSGQAFGRAIGISDLDGDGVFDLSIAAPGTTSGSDDGQVFTWYGRTSWPSTPALDSPDITRNNPLAASTAGGVFGFALD